MSEPYELDRAPFLAEGGDLEFLVMDPFETDDSGQAVIRYLLTREKFVEGFSKWLNEGPLSCINGDVVNTKRIPPYEADRIIQFALFGELVYGE